MELEARLRLAPKARLRPDAASGKLALLSPERLLFLNASGAAIVGLLDGARTVSEIVATLAAQVGQSPSDLTAEVCGYLDKLLERRLVERVQP